MAVKKLTHTASFMGYALLMLLLFLPYLRGDVVAPTRLSSQFGIKDDGARQDSRFENTKFSDYSNVFLSEVDAFLNGPRSGNVALWTDHSEFGRPLYHVSGFSPVYLPARLLQVAAHSPERFITAWSLSLVFLSGVFILLFCQQLGLTPLAGMTSAISYAASPVMLYWLAFPMFLSSWCWAAGCAWSLRRLADRADFLSWTCASFCAYSLLMTSYPQLTVYQVYLVGGYAAAILLRSAKASPPTSTRFAFQAGSAGLVAFLLAAPMLADIFGATLQSNRLRPEEAFFLASLPRLSSLSDISRMIVLQFMPNLFGIGTRPGYPTSYDGLSAALLTTSLIAAGIIAKVRLWRSWWGGVVLIVMFATIKPVYLFGVAHLGLGLSRTNPLSMLLMPCVMLQAYTIDSLERDQSHSRRVASLMVLSMLILVASSVAFGVSQGWPIFQSQIAVSIVIIVLATGICAGKLGTELLVLASACWLAFVAAPTLLRQKPSQIHTQSPLVDAVRGRLQDHARFAVAAPGITALPPNFNGLVGLDSVHSYDSLSPRSYQIFLHRLGGVTTTYGRWNDYISPNYSGAPFWMSDVALVLSPVKLSDPALSCSTHVDEIWLCDVPQHMGRTLQLAVHAPRYSDPTTGIDVGDPRTLPSAPSKVVKDEGDAIEIAVTAAPASLLILSQQYHPDWHAEAFSGGRWTPTRSLPINGFFQGAIVPDQAEKIALTFRPAVRYAYLANYVWTFLIVLLAAKAFLSLRAKFGHAHE